MNIRSRQWCRRRAFLAGSMGGGLALHFARPAFAEAILTDDGLYRQPWFLESFLELADDLEAAAASGKRFAVMWELRGCILLQGNASGELRQARDRGLRPATIGSPAAQHHRRARGHGF